MTRKRRSSLSNDQLVFTFDAPPMPTCTEAELAGLDRMVAACVSRVLREQGTSRYEIAAQMSELLAEDISKHMLDAYAAEAREDFNISLHRFLALIAVSKRYDVLDALVRRIGAAVLVGEEIHTARLGHIDRQIAELKAQRKSIESGARPISRGMHQA